MSMTEYIVTSSPEQGIDIYDLNTLNHIRSINCNIAAQCKLLFINDTHILITTTDKHKQYTTCLAVYNIYTGYNIMRCNITEHITSAAISHNKQYVVLGIGDNGKCVIYELITGNILYQFTAHYKSISNISFNYNDTLLITAGNDTIVNIWRTSELLRMRNDDNDNSTAQLQPYQTYSPHSLPITDLHIQYNMIYTISIDYTVAIYNTDSKQIRNTYKLNCALHTLCVTPDQQSIYVGGSDSAIYKLNPHTSHIDTLIGHTNKVLSIRLNFNGSQLVSCSNDNVIHIHDTNTLQSIKQIKHNKRHSIAHLSLLYDNMTALGFIDQKVTCSTNNNVLIHKNIDTSHYVYPPFKRIYNPSDLTPELILLRPYSTSYNYKIHHKHIKQSFRNNITDIMSELQHDDTNNANDTNQSIHSLTNENQSLKSELRRYKYMNQQLYQLASKHIVPQI